jgi:replicative DNA helicase
VPDRSAPQNLQAEQAILGAILLAHGIPDACNQLKPEHFYSTAHGLIYGVLQGMEAVDTLLLSTELKNRGLIENAGGQAQIDLLAACVPAAGHLPFYVKEVMWCADLRAYIRAAQCMIEAAYARDEARLVNGLAWFRGEKPNVVKLPSRRAA